MNWTKILIAGAALLLSSCCGKWYNFRGVNIPADVQTFSVDFFGNEAQLVNPQLSMNFTEKLKNKFQGETRLGLSSSSGDFKLSGAIKDYRVEPAALNNTTGTSQNKFTISVRVTFECPKHPEKNFTDREFSFFRTFDATENFSGVESNLSADISDNIIQQIFAAIALDW
ncbi:MAG: LptE family protein [Bacteroidetes bacterium]|nr:LptE family protein [Bacteroidota bacterium]